MLCTKCSDNILPVVAIDIDGTMGDYHSHFLSFAEKYLGRAGQDWMGYSGHGKFSEWFMQAYDVDYRTWQDIKLAYRQGAQKRSMPPYHAWVDFARWAYDQDLELWITTTRPFLRMDNIDPDTREWLNRNQVPYDGLLYDEDKYARLAERIARERVIAVYDDLPEMCDEAAREFGFEVPFQPETRWNRNASRGGGGAAFARIHLTNRLNSWRSVRERANA